MTLLERDTQLAELAASLRDAAAGQGSVVVITGEAGAGKTSLVWHFAAEHDDDARVLWGLCDELVTPRPLGPFRDMFPWLVPGTVGPDGARMAESGDILGTLFDEVIRPPCPTIIVVEDAQWADAATLDAIRFLGRRIARQQALLVVTYRDDEVAAGHAIRVALGAISAAQIRRIELPPLSIDAVSQLAGRADVTDVYELTGGNPFFVRELLAAPDAEMPATVLDAVLSRVGRLREPARACVEFVAAVPGGAEPSLLEASGVSGGLDEAVRAGVLRHVGESAVFGHELVRQAVRHSLAEAKWRDLNGLILDALIAQEADPARVAHHAVAADRPDAVVTYAPEAARRAGEVGAHAEAVEHYGRALEHEDRFDAGQLLDLLEGYVGNGSLLGARDDVYRAAERAVEMCRAMDDQTRLGRNLFRLAGMAWSCGDGAAALHVMDEAIEVLEAEPAGPDLVRAYGGKARLWLLDHRRDAVGWAERSIDTARRCGLEPPADAMVTVGSVALQHEGDTSGLERALEVALAQRDRHAVARAYVNLGDELTIHMRYPAARRWIDEGMDYFEANDFMVAIDHMRAVRARWHLDQSDWLGAERDSRGTIGVEGTPQTMAELVLGLVQVRRGDNGAGETLGRAYQHAEQSGETQHVVPVALARAEMAWLHGDMTQVVDAIFRALDRIHDSQLPRWVGEAQLWLSRAGALDVLPVGSGGEAASPYRLQVAGQWREAAAAWAELGRIYDEADALAEADEPEPLLAALAILDRLGAAPRAEMVRQRLAELGVRAVPRGPRETTAANPAGLTLRQVEVLELLAEQLTYREIADHLQLSVKTIDRHVTAIRAKLNVGSRTEAVDAARELGLLS